MAYSFRRIGHKGADGICPGNTIESFIAAVEAGADLIEFDVLRDRAGRLVVAHDYGEADSRPVLELREALDAFRRPPLDQVEFDCDLKLRGREAELAGAISGAGLLDRAMVSTMEIDSLIKLRGHEPTLRRGWTFPKTQVDWAGTRWAGPVNRVALSTMRRRFPEMLRTRGPELGLFATWVYHPLVSGHLIEAAHSVGIEVIAWTVDDPDRIFELAALGVDGIVSNDPRLFAEAFGSGPAMPPAPIAPTRPQEQAPETVQDTGEAILAPAVGESSDDLVAPASPSRPEELVGPAAKNGPEALVVSTMQVGPEALVASAAQNGPAAPEMPTTPEMPDTPAAPTAQPVPSRGRRLARWFIDSD